MRTRALILHPVLEGTASALARRRVAPGTPVRRRVLGAIVDAIGIPFPGRIMLITPGR
jgi:hypothetical protein